MTQLIAQCWDFNKMKYNQNYMIGGTEALSIYELDDSKTSIISECILSYVNRITVIAPHKDITSLIIGPNTFENKFCNLIFFDMSKAINIKSLTICKKAFYANGSLGSFTFPPNLETLIIEEEAFKYCLNLRLNFNECTSLKSLTLESRVFSDCISFDNYKIPENCINFKCNDDSFVGLSYISNTGYFIPKTIQTVNVIDSYNKSILDNITRLNERICNLEIYLIRLSKRKWWSFFC